MVPRCSRSQTGSKSLGVEGFDMRDLKEAKALINSWPSESASATEEKSNWQHRLGMSSTSSGK
jgi:hypothetical protein